MGVAFTMAAATPSLAQEVKITTADTNEVDTLIDPVLHGLREATAGEAIKAYLATGKTGVFGEPQVNMVVSQVANALAAYGPVHQCALVDEETKAALMLRRTYLCQHEKFLTRWIFVVVKLPDGWKAGSIFFDDKIDQLF
jgi:hypothetical protein